MTRYRVEPGQPISTAFSAAGWNRAQDAADVVIGAGPGAAAGSASVSMGGANVVTLQNATGDSLPIYSIVGVQSLANSAAAFSGGGILIGTSPIMLGGLPSATNNVAVLLEPLASGAYGRAAIAGCFAVRVEQRISSHRYLISLPGNTLTMKTSACGNMRLLAMTGYGEGSWKWALGAF